LVGRRGEPFPATRVAIVCIAAAQDSPSAIVPIREKERVIVGSPSV
jgi:hypothetical protein